MRTRKIETGEVTLGVFGEEPLEVFRPVATTSIVKNNRGQMARVSTQFADGIPAESETISGNGSYKPGEILMQHQWLEGHNGKGKRRFAITGQVDGQGGLAWTLDSTTTDPSGSKGQEDSAPITLNVGEAKGSYLTLFADGRLNFKYGGQEYETTLNAIARAIG